jgi:hypothetical protein
MKPAAIRPTFLARAARFFQQDFSSVRVIFSTEPTTVSALAFAGREEIHLIPEIAAQAPERLSQIMIHELAHIVQQRAGRVYGTAGSAVIDPHLEAEADDCAELFAAGSGVAPFAFTSRRVVGPRPSGIIQPISRDKYMFIPAAANLAPTDQTAKVKYDEFLGKVKAAFGGNKDLRTKAATASHGTMVDTLQSGGKEVRELNAGVLLSYEKAHLQGGGNWSTFKTTLSLLRLNPGDGVAPATEILQIAGAPDVNGLGTATIKCKLRNAIPAQFASNPRPADKKLFEYTLGTVLFGDSRFTLAKIQPSGALNQVYVRGKVIGDAIVSDGVSGRHYIRLSNSDSYVKRYVVRGINHQDAAALDGRQNLTAPVGGDTANNSELRSSKKTGRHDTQQGKPLTEKQQMISHARGWQKRYISTGVSKRDAYSTRGEKFDGIYGAVLVDLAMVPEKTIFDLHTPAAAQKLLSLNAMTVESAGGPGLGTKTIEGEEFLALRDVLRTRELLIKKSVPVEAVRKHDLGKCITGIGVLKRVDEAAMTDRLSKLGEVPPYLRKDVIAYRGHHNRYWFFMRFANAVDAGKMLTALRTAPIEGEEYIDLSAYGMPMDKQEGQ